MMFPLQCLLFEATPFSVKKTINKKLSGTASDSSAILQ